MRNESHDSIWGPDVAKKKTTRKKKTSAKKSASKKASTKKKVTRKKASAGRGAPKKKTGARKKTSARAAVSKKASVKKKTTRKKTTAKKSPASKKASVKKKTTKKTTKKAPTSKKTASKTKTTKKASGGKKSSSRKTSARAQKEEAALAQANAPTLTDARAAAAKLAAMAGLPTLKKRIVQSEEREETRPKLKKSPFNKRQLDKYRAVLLIKRAQVLGDVTDMEGEALGRGDSELSSLPQHLADQGSDEYDQSLALGLAASQRALLTEIDDAIGRIDKKIYGICEMTGVSIKQERLDETPWARYSVEGARQADAGQSRS
ncbi:MAG: TraR/DksA family transcriptional regulator [Planctomycetota bacterium]